MSAHPPPVPPEQRSDKRAGAATEQNRTNPKEAQKERYDPRGRDPTEQGRQGAVKQNTTNKGYQQDR
ncbi:MAG TPA: hypothetical protein VE690_15780 [Rhodopila sp.]|nr:hypothetical protein [Rhodopila sp.]